MPGEDARHCAEWLRIVPALVNISLKQTLFASFAAVFMNGSNLDAVEAPQRSVSPSGQFVAYGADAVTRGAVCDLAERTKKNLLSVLRRHDDWKIPAVINLQPRAANMPELRTSQLEFGISEEGVKLQLDLAIGSEINVGAIEHELARVILLEMMYRKTGRIVVGDAYVDPPEWLVEGLLTCAPNRNDWKEIEALNATEHLPSLSEFLQQRVQTLDPAARDLYRPYSYSLIKLLVEPHDGPARLGRYIDNLSNASNDPLADLRKVFPELRDQVWHSEIGNLKLSTGEGLISFAQTDSRLDEVLRIRFPSADGRENSISLEELLQRRLTSQQRQALQKFSHRLLILATQANPLLRPIVEEYQQLADQLALGRHRGLTRRLAELNALHENLAKRMSEVDDYMNWFEAAKLETPSGLFEPAAEVKTTKRKDPISIYLDAMELEF